MKTVDEELKPETVETLDLRGDIGFLLKDEVEAIDGYDRVLKRAELTKEQKNMLEEIRNDELEHVDKLNEIYRTLATGEIEEGNDIVKYNKDSKIRDYKSNELIAHIRELYKTIGKDKIEQYKEILKKKGGYRDLGTRLAWDALHVATHNAGERMSDWYDKYEVNDNHIDSAAKKVLREMGVSLVDANKLKDEDPIQKIVGRKLKTSLDVLDLVKIYLGNYKWHNNPDGTMAVSTDAGKYIIKFKYEPKKEENSERVIVSNITKIEDGITGSEYEEANVNEPLNPMCDSEDMIDDIMEEQLEMQQLKDVNTKLSKNTLKDSDTSNDIGLYSVGCKYRWEDKYGNTILSLTDICPTGEIKLNLDKNVFILLPMEKFEEMLRSGKIKETDTLNIGGYDKVSTKKNFKVKFGDRTFIVKAKDSIEAVEAVRGKVKELEDDRLSPMTYKKLKELGYSNKQWSNWTQEQANAIVAKKENKGNPNKSKENNLKENKQIGSKQNNLTKKKEIPHISPKKYNALSEEFSNRDEIWSSIAQYGVDETFDNYGDELEHELNENVQREGDIISKEEIKLAMDKYFEEMLKSDYFEGDERSKEEINNLRSKTSPYSTNSNKQTKPVKLSPKKYEDLSDIMSGEDEIWNNLAKNGVDKTFKEYEDLISETYLDNTGKTVSSEEIKAALQRFYKDMEKSGYFEE